MMTELPTFDKICEQASFYGQDKCLYNNNTAVCYTNLILLTSTLTYLQ